MSGYVATVLALTLTPVSIGLAFLIATSHEPLCVIPPGFKLRLWASILLFFAGLGAGIGIGVLL